MESQKECNPVKSVIGRKNEASLRYVQHTLIERMKKKKKRHPSDEDIPNGHLPPHSPDSLGDQQPVERGVWVNAEVKQGKLTVQPLTSVDLSTSAYQTFLGDNFSSLNDGFFVRVSNEHMTPSCSCTIRSIKNHNYVYEVLNPKVELLFTTMTEDQPSPSSPASIKDTDSEHSLEIEEEGIVLLMFDEKRKCLLKIKISSGSLYKGQSTRIEAPPGVLMGWILKKKPFMRAASYELYEGTEPVSPSIYIKKYPKHEHLDDEEQEQAQEPSMFSCLFPCRSNGSPATSMFEVQEILPPERRIQQTSSAMPITRSIGMLFGSSQLDNMVSNMSENKEITCSFKPTLSIKKKVLILCSIFLIHANGDIA